MSRQVSKLLHSSYATATLSSVYTEAFTALYSTEHPPDQDCRLPQQHVHVSVNASFCILLGSASHLFLFQTGNWVRNLHFSFSWTKTLKQPVNCWYQAGDFAGMKNPVVVALRAFLDTTQKAHAHTTPMKILPYEIWSHQRAHVLQTAVNNRTKLVLSGNTKCS